MKNSEVSEAKMNRDHLLLLLCIVSIETARADAIPIEHCLQYSASAWQVPIGLLKAVRVNEAGTEGQMVCNDKKHHTCDVGPFQHNTATIMRLSKYGVTVSAMRDSYCASSYVAAWTLRQSFNQHKAWPYAIAAYNCGDPCVSKALRAGRQPVVQLNIPQITQNYVDSVMQIWRTFQ